MDARLDQNQAELAVLVLAVALEVLADSDGLEGWDVSWGKGEGREGQRVGRSYLLDQEVKVLGNFGGEACGWKKSLCQPCVVFARCKGTNAEALGCVWLFKSSFWWGLCGQHPSVEGCALLQLF